MLKSPMCDLNMYTTIKEACLLQCIYDTSTDRLL